MGNNVDDIPWPAPKPRKPKGNKKPGSGGGPPGTVGIGVVLFIGLPMLVLSLIAYVVLDGYYVI